MVTAESKKNSGRIETDDAYLDGKHKGRRERGSENKQPFIVAAATNEEKPLRGNRSGYK